MSEGHFFSRRARVIGAAVIILAAVAGGVWFTTHGDEPRRPAVIQAGPPVVKSGVGFTPIRKSDPAPGAVDGYTIHLPSEGKTLDALKAGKKVILAGPTGGKIEIKQLEPTPPPPREKK